MADWSQQDLRPEDEEGVISQEDCWSVIQSYFDENVSSVYVPSFLTFVVARTNTNRLLR